MCTVHKLQCRYLSFLNVLNFAILDYYFSPIHYKWDIF